MKSRYKSGQRIVIIKEQSCLPGYEPGTTGTIREVDGTRLYTEFDDKENPGHGFYYLYESNVRVIDDALEFWK